MVNRRFLRVKVMQSLYSYLQSGNNDLAKAEKELFQSIDKVYDLYIYLVSLLIDIHHSAHLLIEDNKNKRLPTQDDLNPNRKFIDHPILLGLSQNLQIKKEIANRKVSWQNDFDLVKKVFNEIRVAEEYKSFMNSGKNDPVENRKFLEVIVRNFIADNDIMEFWLEEKNIHWVDDYHIAVNAIIKTIETSNDAGEILLPSLYKDAEDDKQFMRTLLSKSIIHNDEYESLISEKTKNWEIERIAFLDVLLMKMSITEILNISNVPVKVTLNEYIEIAKQYSTPKSKIFINGILDKLVADLKAKDKIKKTGRGLLES
jgi:N utilization substance protein B